MNAMLGGTGVGARTRSSSTAARRRARRSLTIRNIGGGGGADDRRRHSGDRRGQRRDDRHATRSPSPTRRSSAATATRSTETGRDLYLVSTPTTTPAQVASSVTSIAKAQQQAIITGRVLGSILLGATEQVNCSNCSSGFGSIGSYALGAHGRTSLTPELTAMGGFSYDEYSAQGITVTNAPTFAGLAGLRSDQFRPQPSVRRDRRRRRSVRAGPLLPHLSVRRPDRPGPRRTRSTAASACSVGSVGSTA